MTTDKTKLILKLFEYECFQFGNFILKTGISSPFYIDLRNIFSNNDIMDLLVKLINGLIQELKYDYIIGVPFAGMYIANYLCAIYKRKCLLMRKEYKKYGLKRLVEGKHTKNSNILLIDDVITSGSSLIETSNKLVNENLKVSNIIVLIDRCQGGIEKINEKNMTIHSLFTFNEVLSILHNNNKLQNIMYKKCIDFVSKNKFIDNSNNLVDRLKLIMANKKTNLIVAADVTKKEDLYKIIENVGNHICILKTHIDILDNFDESVITKLKYYGNKYNFLIFEDRKLSDIGNTIKNQLFNGIYKIFDWADIISFHTFIGDGFIKEYNIQLINKNKGIVLICDMSNNNNFDENIKRLSLEYTNKYSSVIGIVSSKYKKKKTDKFLVFTPGVSITIKKDSLDQKYKGVDEIKNMGSDIIIVGRGIINNPNIEETAIKYKQTFWNLKK